MSKTFSITKTSINVNELNRNICEYLSSNKDDPYLFMNDRTLEELILFVGYSAERIHGVSKSYMCGRFCGCKVFCDDTLKFGEVEIR